MTSLELTREMVQIGYRPLAGRILLEIEPPDEMSGTLHIPQTAQHQTAERDHLVKARVLSIGYGPFMESGGTGVYELLQGLTPEEISIGDAVLYHPLLKDLNKTLLLTSVTRVEAILG